MNRNAFNSLMVFCVLLSITSCKNRSQTKNEEVAEKFAATWESLATIEREPEWFKDAKLGIYFHWGPYSVPAYDNEWYPRWMYTPGRKDWGGTVYEFHKKNFGPLSEFNYHDFIPMFTAEHFDAAEWADLFQKSGASFAGPVAQHHDGFAMWGSKINPWNAKDMDYNHKDIRFAVSKDNKNLFVYSLGLPEPNSSFDIHNVAESNIKRVSVVGSSVELKWSKNGNILTITTPGSSEMDELATVFKIELQ